MNNKLSFAIRVVPRLALAVALAGCGSAPVPEFRLNMVDISRAQLNTDQRQQIANILEAMYGTPDEPFQFPTQPAPGTGKITLRPSTTTACAGLAASSHASKVMKRTAIV